MKKTIQFVVIAFTIAVFSFTAHAKRNVIKTLGGVNVPQLSIVIDASYDPRLDTLVPGYRVINVGFVNQSMHILALDPERDKWSIKLADESRFRPVIHDLRSADPKAWNALPDKVKNLTAYPLALLVGAQVAVDLFVPDNIDASKFSELKIYMKSTDTEINVVARQ